MRCVTLSYCKFANCVEQLLTADFDKIKSFLHSEKHFALHIFNAEMNPQPHIGNLRQILGHAIAAARPESVLANKSSFNLVPKVREGAATMRLRQDLLKVENKRLHIVGFGKAVLGMACRLIQDFGPLLSAGILSTPVGSMRDYKALTGTAPQHACLDVYEGALNNIPDEAAHSTAKRILELANGLTDNDILFVLISGGGSALLPVPTEPVLTLTQKIKLIRQLGSKGADIKELNTVRIALSEIKGNRLARAARHAHAVVTFAISDIVGDPIDLVASGPTVPITQRDMTARDVLNKYGLYQELSEGIQQLVDAKLPAELYQTQRNTLYYLIGSNRQAAEAALLAATNQNYNALVLSVEEQGDVEAVADKYARFMKLIHDFRYQRIDEQQLNRDCPFTGSNVADLAGFVQKSVAEQRPMLFIVGGETTVTVRGCGKGGRNQELALRMSLQMHKQAELQQFVFLSAGTDGQDGPTTAAGAFGGAFVVEDFLAADPRHTVAEVQQFLANNDTFSFYASLKGGAYHIVTGHTATNVMDLQFMLMM